MQAQTIHSKMIINSTNTETNPLKQVEAALTYLAHRCDYADNTDRAGFNKLDTGFGHSLAEQIERGDELSYKQAEIGLKIVTKYKNTQLVKAGLELPTPQELKEHLGFLSASRISRTELRRVSYKYISPSESRIIIKFDYNVQVLQTVKTLNNVHFNNDNYKNLYWYIELDSERFYYLNVIKEVYEKLQPSGFEFDQTLIDDIQSESERIRIESEEVNERINWIREYYRREYKKWAFTPYSHQFMGSKFLLSTHNMRALIADDQGLGKSLTSLMAVKAAKSWLIESGVTDKIAVIVVSPVSVKTNWLREAKKIDLKIEVFSSAKVPSPPDSIKYICIYDEAHYFKSPSAKRTKQAEALALHENCLGLALLTGTPMKNGRPHELYSLLKMIKHPIACNKKKFERRFCDAKPGRFTAWDTTGSSNLNELNRVIGDVVIRRTKDECLDLPARQFISVDAEKISKAEKEYKEDLDKLKDKYFQRVELGEISDAAQALVFLGMFRKLSSNFKSHHTINMVEDLLEQDEQVIVFTDFVDSAERIAAEFGIEPITGKVSQQRRQEIVDNFQSGEQKVFVGTIKSCGAGITLTKSAYMIMNDFTWNLDYNQATDRNYRIGQERKVVVYNVFGKDIDFVMAETLDQKHENIGEVLKGLDIKVPERKGQAFYTDLLKKLMGTKKK